MKILNKIAFFVLAPIYIPMTVLMMYTFEWWTGLMD